MKEIKKDNEKKKINFIKKNKNNNSKKINNTKKEENIKKNISNKKKVKDKTATKKKIMLALKILLIIFIVGIISVLITAAIFLGSIVKNAPEFKPENLYQQESTIMYDANGEIIAKLGIEKRENISYEELPEVLVNAIIATEDSRFFQHNGFDLPRFLVASFGQLLGRDAGGASTLTMQLSKNYVSQNTVSEGMAGIKRKFTDIYMSMFKIEKNYTKKEIIEFYVNSNFLGGTSVISGGAYGVEQACLTYFGKNAKDINVAEAALIAGLFQAPYSYDPYLHPEAAEKRRQTVLYLMERHGYITPEEHEIAKELTVDKLILKNPESMGGEYQGFIDTVANEIMDEYGINPYTTPLEIWTTMDRTKQNHVNSIMNGTESPVTGLTYEWQNDVVNAGISVIDVKTGALVAVGAGRHSGDKALSFNYATDINNQIGSTAKPLYDYGPGIEFNNWSTYTPFADEPHGYTNGVKIENWNYTYNGFLTLRQAVMGSWNIPALKAFQSNDKSNIIKFVTGLGLTPEIYSCSDGYKRSKNKCINEDNQSDIVDAKKSDTLHEAHALGGYNGESPLTLSAAYAAFANGGYYIEPHSYTKFTYRTTGETVEKKIQKTRAMSEQTAYMITDVLISTASSALGRYSYVNGATYGAKTGTSNYPETVFRDYNLPSNAVNDIWVAGISPEYSIAVWYGYDQVYSDYYNVISSGQNSRIFQAVAKGVFTNTSAKFTKPSGVVSVTVEKESYPAALPSEFTPDDMKVTELFKSGTEPTDVSTRYSKLNNVTNLKANVKDSKVTLTWNKIDTPDAINLDYLNKYFESLYGDATHRQKALNNRLSYNANNIGTVIYNIYLKDDKGNLTSLGTTENDTYDYTVKDGGTYTFVVKSSYTIFKSNISDGIEVKVNIDKKNDPTDDDNNVDNINIGLNGDSEISLNIGDKYNEKSVIVIENEKTDVTDKATINITIVRKSDGKTVNEITTSSADIYTVTYKVKYKKASKTLTRKVNIVGTLYNG